MSKAPKWAVTLTQLQIDELEKRIPDINARATEVPTNGRLPKFTVHLTNSESNLALDLLGEEPMPV